MVYLHEDFANDDIIIVLEHRAKYDSDTVLHGVNVPTTITPASFPVHVSIGAILFFFDIYCTWLIVKCWHYYFE